MEIYPVDSVIHQFWTTAGARNITKQKGVVFSRGGAFFFRCSYKKVYTDLFVPLFPVTIIAVFPFEWKPLIDGTSFSKRPFSSTMINFSETPRAPHHRIRFQNFFCKSFIHIPKRAKHNNLNSQFNEKQNSSASVLYTKVRPRRSVVFIVTR